MAKGNGTMKEIVENGAETIATEAVETAAKKLFVTREPFKSKGKTYLAYMLKGKVRGRDIKVDLMPPKAGRNTDGGGYEVLDIVFDGAEKADFVQEFEEYMQDGKKMTRTVYTVQSVDKETGQVFKCNVIPTRPSDRALLEMLIASA